MSPRPMTKVMFMSRARSSARCRAAAARLLLPVLAVCAWTAILPSTCPFSVVPVMAEDGTWSAQEVAGTVLVRGAGQTAAGWQPVSVAMALNAESEIATGPDGIALLSNGDDRIRMSPNSRLTLPAVGSDLLTVIRMRLGRVLFDVAPRSEGRFEVEAPYLAVLVKGTHFVVDANYIENSVSVVEGDVQTRRTEGETDENVDVGGGETAGIAGPNGTLTVSQTGSSGGGDAEQSNGGPEEKLKVTVAAPGEPEPEEP